uniref:Uncharacterized protein n=2 Tax=unclassified Mycobacterium TaxID=2642494 RepID=A1UJR1_MYCSK
MIGATGSPQQAAEKVAADLAALAEKLDVLRERPDWHHDDVLAPALAALTSAAKSTPAQRAKRRAAKDEARADELARAKAARNRFRTPASDRRTGGPNAVKARRS